MWGLQVQNISSEGNSLWVIRQFNRVTLNFGPTNGKKLPICHDNFSDRQFQKDVSIANVAKVFSLKPVVSGKEVAAEKILKLV
jgi:hypothetical protein